MGDFPTTRWTVIEAARGGHEAALRDFAQRYRPAVLSYLQRSGLDPDAAEDVTQEVFLQLFHRGVLVRADPRRGRFRSLLAAVAKHMASERRRREQTQKRGHGRVRCGLEQDPPAPMTEDAFDREWVGNLLRLALSRLQREHPNYHAAVKGALLEGRSQADVAADLGTGTKSVKNHVGRGRQKLIAYMREEVARYALDREDYVEELAFLSSFFPL